MAPPKYVQRFARLPHVFQLLAENPEGMALSDLGERLGVDPDELRQDLLAYFTADHAGMLGLSRPADLRFTSADGNDDIDPNVATVVQIIDERASEELGVELVDGAELGLIYTAAQALLDVTPDDQDLREAVEVLTATLFGQEPVATSPLRAGHLAELQTAREQRTRVRIGYSNSWRVGTGDRVIEPYRLVQTRRGWEVDAGPLDDNGRMRTFLLSNIRSVETTDETFTDPDRLEERLADQRATTGVRVRIPHAARWAADMYAESIRVVSDGEQDVTLDLEMLPPVEQRVALLALSAGEDAVVLDPPGLVAGIPALAADLLAHHSVQP